MRSGAATALPSGTVTFAFTDIEASTLRWERDAAAMAGAVRRHDTLVRAAIVGHGGRVFKTVGDAFCAAFSRPQDAVAAMLAAQRVLAAEDFSAVDGLRMRAAIHTGTAEERDGDYFGPVVNRVARLLAIAHGGQVLLSGVTHDLAAPALPPETSLLHLGDHRLKDLARTERVYQAGAAGLAAEFPPLRSLSAVANNLPVGLSSFVGREDEIGAIATLLANHRLVTLIGSGGIGKTRTSVQVAANLAARFADGLWFIELAPVSSGTYIATTVAKALAVTLGGEGDPLSALTRALTKKHALLVFDNCEHVIEAVGEVIAAILRGCPGIRVLATSRQALRIAGETTFRLPSLGVPGDANDMLAASYTAPSAAMALFADRARAVDHLFKLNDDNATAVADICRRLDGIPLAIELAAARVNVLSPSQLRERLDERFRVLTGGSRDALPRQQTLRALIDWSFDQLSDAERVVFRRLAVFVNGFALDGAIAVGVTEDIDEFDVVELLALLVEKSLVLSEDDGDSLRYRLLESTRLYALEKLTAANERDGCAVRHLRYLRDRFHRLRDEAERTARSAAIDSIFATELEGVRAALDHAADARAAAELLAEIGWNWSRLGLGREGEQRVERALAAMPGSESVLPARLCASLARMCADEGRPARGFDVATQAIAFARRSADGPVLGEVLHIYATCARQMRQFDVAEAALTEAAAIPGTSTALRLRLLSSRSSLDTQRGDFAAAARGLEQIRVEHRLLGNARSERIAALNLAEAEHARGQTERAIAIVRDVLPGFAAQSDTSVLANVLANLAGYLAAVDDLPGAAAAARQAVDVLAAREPDGTYVASALEHLALTLALRGDLPGAAVLAGYVDAAFARAGVTREITEATTHDRLAALLRDRLPADELETLLSQGEALTPSAAVARGLAG